MLSSPLSEALRKGSVKEAEIALMNGADPNGKCPTECYSYYDTILVCAITQGCTDFVRLLLKYGADVEKKTYFETTPLVCAARFGTEEIVSLLLDYNAKIDDDSSLFGHCALSEAIQAGRRNIISLLRRRGARDVVMVQCILCKCPIKAPANMLGTCSECILQLNNRAW